MLETKDGNQFKSVTKKVSTSYFQYVQNVHYIKNVELKFQPQFVFNSCFGFRAKFQNNKVSEISKFCNHINLNNVSNSYVNTDYVEVSSYCSVMSMAKRPVSTALDQDSDHIQSKVEISTPLPAPSLLFEASGRFFGVVYNDVSQETFCDSSTGCPTVSSIEGATNNVAILQNSTSKTESFKNGPFQNVGASKAQNAKMQGNRASKSSSYTQDVLVSGQQYNDDSHTAPATAAPFENLDKQGACVKNSKHIFEDQKCLPGGSKGLSDNDNFDLWTSLGSVNEIPNYVSLPDSVKKLIHKNKDVFCSKLTAVRHIKSDPVKISIRGGRFQKLKPCYRARPIPAHWFTKGKSILADLEEQGLIVRVTEASEYCSPCFFIPKPHDPTQPRLVVDYSLINDIILRPVFPLASPEMVWRRVPKGKGRWWISNDLTSSYWQVRISEESQGITTFISEFGRFRWCVFPQGLSCSGDEFGQRQNLQTSSEWLMI